jgi:paraquat-inducible protein B
MPEQPPTGPEADIPEAAADARWWRWAQLIWIVPIVAVVIAGWLGVRAVLSRGPTIEITFETASGLEANKTSVRYKDVEVGTVTSIRLSDDRSRVVVSARLTPQARDLVVEDTKFWVVRPRITGGQALGLGTILSGAYIALDPGQSKDTQRRFEGLEAPPAVTSDARGRQFILRADDMGSIDVGSPVYFRRVRVGQIVSAALDAEGKGVTFRAFVNQPHDQYVTTASRFWNASGIDLSLDARGLRLETQSLLSIAIGGVAFEEPADAKAGPPAAAGAEFTLHENREAALRQPPKIRDRYILYFNQSVRGLGVGAPVDFRGVVIGDVARVSLDYNRARATLRPAVEINIYPERLAASLREPGVAQQAGERRAMWRRFIERGLRAQLRTANLITGTLYVTLDMFPKEPPVRVKAGADPLEIPTLPGGFEELQTSVANVMKKLEQVPFNEIAADLRTTVNTLDGTLREVNTLVTRLDTEIAPELRAALKEARATLDRAQQVLAQDSPIQGDMRATLRDVSRAAQSMRNLADYLERHPESILRGRRGESP